jgi:hypothetical protein
MRLPRTKHLTLLAAVTALLAGACVLQGPGSGELHRWWSGFGPVLPHDNFPADCKLCHVGERWNTLATNFSFDHEKQTGVPLIGAHANAKCLRCHNDRGPVGVFYAKGCVGCHEDFHYGDLGKNCTRCHDQVTWRPEGQIAKHQLTRFPLIGSHAAVACHRCHPGALVGNFVPTDTECLTCHARELANANNPPHIALGYVDNCHRCHLPTDWHQASIR